jgi:hypothetical protein
MASLLIVLKTETQHCGTLAFRIQNIKEVHGGGDSDAGTKGARIVHREAPHGGA